MSDVLPTDDDFTSTFRAFVNNLNTVGISSDLSKAMDDASKFFHTLTSRGIIDGLTLAAFTKIFEDMAVLSLDLLQSVIDTLLDVLAHTIRLFKNSLDTPIDIPLISNIFKEIVGLDLTYVVLTIILSGPS